MPLHLITRMKTEAGSPICNSQPSCKVAPLQSRYLKTGNREPMAWPGDSSDETRFVQCACSCQHTKEGSHGFRTNGCGFCTVALLESACLVHGG
jgi:hypothetical protein